MVTMFVGPKKRQARELAQKLISGHVALAAFWALRNAGVLEAIRKQKEGLDPIAFARRANLSADTLEAALTYLTQQGLLTKQKDRVFLTPACSALLEHADGELEMVRAYAGVTGALDHLLAGLKVYGNGVTRKADVFALAQSTRYARDVYAAVESVVAKSGVTHVLDLGCGSGALLVRLAGHLRRVVGVGVCEDGILVRQANAAIAAEGLEKRLIAVTAGALEVCTSPQRTFERIGVSQQLWSQFDCVIACGILTDLAARDATTLTDALGQIPRHFKAPLVLLAEPCGGPKFEKNFYAPEMAFLSKLSRSTPAPLAQWRTMLGKAGLKVLREIALETDGVMLFVCQG